MSNAFDALNAEFEGLLGQYPNNPSILHAAVLHIGLGRIALAIQEHGESLGTRDDGLRSIKDAVDELVHATRERNR